MILFLTIEISEKGRDDYRAFLYFADTEEMLRYEIRGYGETPGIAADLAWNRFNSPERDNFVLGCWKWE